MSRLSHHPSVASNLRGEPAIARHRPPLESTVRRVERSGEPSSRQSFAPARNGTRSAPAGRSNSFESLANETTQAVRVSQELLGLAREDAGGGATKAYEVPPELLVLARANKAKRAASLRAREGAAAELDGAQGPAPESTPAEESTRVTARPPASERAPSVIVADDDLAPPSAAFEQPPSAVVAAQPRVAPARQDVAEVGVGRSRAARWLLIAACVIAVCAVGMLCGKLAHDRQLLHLPAGISLRF